MVMAASEAAVASMTSTIPVIVTGKIVMDFTERMGQRFDEGPIMPKRQKRRLTRRKARQQMSGLKGDFSNLGWR